MKFLKPKLKLLALLGAIFASASLLLSGSAYADERPAHHLGITPTQLKLDTIEPGKSYNGSFDIVNQGSEASSFEIDFKPYSINDNNDQYAPTYDKPSSYTEIADWIEVSTDSGTIPTGERQKINFTVNVPADAHGGSQSAIIVVRLKDSKKDESSNAVEAIQELGYLVYGNVDGDIIKTANIIENKIPSFLFNPPVIATSIVENTGNVYTTATYTLSVSSFFGDEEIYSNEEEPEQYIVFPETKRLINLSWDSAPHLGIFKVKQTVKIFDEESVVEKVVFLCPIWFLVIVLAFIAILIFMIVSRISKRKE